MAKPKAKFNSHVRLYNWFLQSAAWKHLNVTERALLVELYSFYNGQNNGKLFLSIRDAANALNISPNTASNAFKGLQSHGFIQINVPGGFTLKTRHATSWRLTEFDQGQKVATKDFMTWKPQNERKKRY